MRNANKEVIELLDQLYRQAKMQFGDAIKSRWFHTDDGCPGCGRKVGAMKYKGQDNLLSLNAFIYREHGVLIGYLLCGKCGNKVIRATTDTPLHAEIEKNLKRSFLKHHGH